MLSSTVQAPLLAQAVELALHQLNAAIETLLSALTRR
jgi:hypothetical protein